jgi:hypothetical protein
MTTHYSSGGKEGQIFQEEESALWKSAERGKVSLSKFRGLEQWGPCTEHHGVSYKMGM